MSIGYEKNKFDFSTYDNCAIILSFPREPLIYTIIRSTRIFTLKRIKKSNPILSLIKYEQIWIKNLNIRVRIIPGIFQLLLYYYVIKISNNCHLAGIWITFVKYGNITLREYSLIYLFIYAEENIME